MGIFIYWDHDPLDISIGDVDPWDVISYLFLRLLIFMQILRVSPKVKSIKMNVRAYFNYWDYVIRKIYIKWGIRLFVYLLIPIYDLFK